MSEQFVREELLIGNDALYKLHNSKVLLFGLGGVGGTIAEALVRAGIGEIGIADNDIISLSNINRQIFATHKTVGKLKTDVAEERLKDINPNVVIYKYPIFFTSDNSDKIDFGYYDYIIDAIDSVSSKIEIITKSNTLGVPVISCMGTGNKLHPEMFEIEDIYKTSVCPLARKMRTELKKIGIKKLKVLYSKETPQKTDKVPSSISYVPPVAGYIIVSEVVKDLIS